MYCTRIVPLRTYAKIAINFDLSNRQEPQERQEFVWRA